MPKWTKNSQSQLRFAKSVFLLIFVALAVVAIRPAMAANNPVGSAQSGDNDVWQLVDVNVETYQCEDWIQDAHGQMDLQSTQASCEETESWGTGEASGTMHLTYPHLMQGGQESTFVLEAEGSFSWSLNDDNADGKAVLQVELKVLGGNCDVIDYPQEEGGTSGSASLESEALTCVLDPAVDFWGMDTAQVVFQMWPSSGVAFGMDEQALAISSVTLEYARCAESDDCVVEEPKRPVIILPGIYGSYLASLWDQQTWVYNRGIHPELLAIDPLAHYYDDIIVTLKNAGYVEGEDLFIGAYDWRMPPGPDDGDYDGVLQGISGLSITDDLYEYGVDYLGYYLKQAAESWQQNHDGEILDSVDIISHSTGGLVARAYIQSTAYGRHFPASDGQGVTLPKVNNLIMVAVPNRGAALPWQAMNNNFIRDAPSKYVMAKILAVGWLKVNDGYTIEGHPAAITRQSTLNPATGQPDPIRFIELYCPTFRSLLATYPFMVDLNGNLVDINDQPEYRNDLVLDLNNGLDLTDQPVSADTNLFADEVNHTVVFYARREATAYRMQEMDTAAENVVFPMDAVFEQDVAEGTIWYQDIVEAVGDGTVPSLSAAGQFEGDDRVEVIRVTDGDTTHTGLMANRQVQTGILDVLGIDWREVEISSGLAEPSTTSVIAAVSDPVGFTMVDNQGRRLGWTPDTGVLTEIPNSVWYGEGDGIGWVFGPVSQPIRVELIGQGEQYYVQVAGEQPDVWAGLHAEGFLDSGQSRSIPVETEARAGESEGMITNPLVRIVYLLLCFLVLCAVVLVVLALIVFSFRRLNA